MTCQVLTSKLSGLDLNEGRARGGDSGVVSATVHLTLAGVSKSRYFVISISIKYSNFSRFYKKKGPFYKKFRCDKFGN